MSVLNSLPISAGVKDLASQALGAANPLGGGFSGSSSATAGDSTTGSKVFNLGNFGNMGGQLPWYVWVIGAVLALIVLLVVFKMGA